MENNWGTDLPENWTKATISDLVGVQGVFRDGDWVESKDQDQNGQVRLIQLADIGDGEFRDKSSRFLISEKAIELNCTFLQAGDILVARMPDPLGRACLFPLQGNKQFVTVVDVCIIRFGNNYTNIKYFMYLLNSPMSRRSISDHQTGSTRKRISRGNLSTVQFPIAPLNEQHRIVAKIEELFSELDKGIENLKTAQAQLKVYRQALLKHAFEGKLTAQWRAQRRAKQTVAPAQAGAQLLNDMDSRPTPSRGQAMRGNDEAGSGNDEPLETAEALLKRIQQERAQRYQQQLAEWEESPSIPLLQRGKPTCTAPIPPLEKGGRGGISKPKPPKSLPPLTAEELAELPELPEGWGWVKYGDLCLIVRNGISAKPEGDSGTSIFRISAVRPLFFDMKDIRFINNSNGEFDAYYLERGDLVFTRYNGSRHYVGVCAEYRSDKKYLFPDKLVQTRVFSENVSTSYLEKALNSGASRRFIDSKIRTTAGQSGISGDDIRNIPVPLCSTDEQMQIVEELESKLSEADQLDQTITTSLQQAEALRQSILKKAFSGQLVPQDPNDEPASELLARIKAERLASQGNVVVRRKGGRS